MCTTSSSFTYAVIVHFLLVVLACIRNRNLKPGVLLGAELQDWEVSLSQALVDPGNAMPKLINLALQGGGSHGAFAWGALDRMLEDERIAIEGIVGTSAGAMNAAVTAYGLAIGGK